MNSRNHKFILTTIISCLLFIAFVSPVLAVITPLPPKPEGDVFTNTFLESAEFTVLKTGEGQDVRLYVVALIKIALSFTGFLFFLLVFYGGYLWMAAGGNEEVLKKAKSIITKAVVGFAIVLAAYSITFFLGKFIGEAIVPSEGNVPGPKQDFILP